MKSPCGGDTDESPRSILCRNLIVEELALSEGERARVPSGTVPDRTCVVLEDVARNLLMKEVSPFQVSQLTFDAQIQMYDLKKLYHFGSDLDIFCSYVSDLFSILLRNEGRGPGNRLDWRDMAQLFPMDDAAIFWIECLRSA